MSVQGNHAFYSATVIGQAGHSLGELGVRDGARGCEERLLAHPLRLLSSSFRLQLPQSESLLRTERANIGFRLPLSSLLGPYVEGVSPKDGAEHPPKCLGKLLLASASPLELVKKVVNPQKWEAGRLFSQYARKPGFKSRQPFPIGGVKANLSPADNLIGDQTAKRSSEWLLRLAAVCYQHACGY